MRCDSIQRTGGSKTIGMIKLPKKKTRTKWEQEEFKRNKRLNKLAREWLRKELR